MCVAQGADVSDIVRRDESLEAKGLHIGKAKDKEIRVLRIPPLCWPILVHPQGSNMFQQLFAALGDPGRRIEIRWAGRRAVCKVGNLGSEEFARENGSENM